MFLLLKVVFNEKGSCVIFSFLATNKATSDSNDISVEIMVNKYRNKQKYDDSFKFLSLSINSLVIWNGIANRQESILLEQK